MNSHLFHFSNSVVSTPPSFNQIIINISMPRAISQPSDTAAAATSAAAYGALKVAQRKVSRDLYVAILSQNRERASKHIQSIFRVMWR